VKRLFPYLILLSGALAQSNLGAGAVQIAPANALVQTAPGAHLVGQIQLTNPTRSPVAVQVFVADFVLLPNGRPEILPPASLSTSLGHWIRLGQPAFQLGPLGQAVLHYSVELPRDLKPGTYWSAIVFRSGTPQVLGNGVRIVAQVAFPLYLDVGQVEHQGTISGIFLQGSPPQIFLSFQNTGNGYYLLSGRLELRNAQGALVKTFSIAPTASLPGELRVFTFDPKGLPAGTYLATAIMNDGTPDLIAGEATLQIP
jgi:hypothetical protein